MKQSAVDSNLFMVQNSRFFSVQPNYNETGQTKTQGVVMAQSKPTP